MIKLSQSKIDDLKSERARLEASLNAETAESQRRGGPMDSFKEAAIMETSLQPMKKRLADITHLLNVCEALPNNILGDKIVLGKWFTIQNAQMKRRFHLVDPAEADSLNNLLSTKSALGKAVINKSKGATFYFNNSTFEILDVE